MQKLRNKIEQTQAKIDAFDEEHESESELQRLKLFKNLQYYFEQVKKELYEILKQQQQKGKSQKEVDKLGESIASKEKERNTLEERPGREYSVGIARSLCWTELKKPYATLQHNNRNKARNESGSVFSSDC